ncbi:hypothetical protein KCP75_26035 [Salmonella enterica subsp. enterica]|nr:hypothetical protein KCP75_26035 [Salmonella enterica subsp. enterica]
MSSSPTIPLLRRATKKDWWGAVLGGDQWIPVLVAGSGMPLGDDAHVWRFSVIIW